MLTVRKAKEKAESEGRAILSLLDAKFASSPRPVHISPGASPGQLAYAASRGPVGGSPVPIIRSIREETARQLRAAKSALVECRQVARWQLKAADFLLGKIDDLPEPPDGVPVDVVASVRAAPHLSAAGLISAADLAKELQNGAARAVEQINEAERAFSRFESGAAVGVAKQSGILALDYGFNEMAAGLSKKAQRMSDIRLSLEARRRGVPKSRKSER